MEKKPNIHIHISLSPVKATDVYNSYWQFAVLRQEVFFNRFESKPFPWTKDPVLNRFKFTNAYRAADRVSQYLIKNVIYKEELPKSPKEVLFRILLFKLFNNIETWELLRNKLGDLNYEEYKFKNYEKILDTAIFCPKDL